MTEWSIAHGSAYDKLDDLPADSVQCCVTSPPYWNLRKYPCDDVTLSGGWTGQLGLETKLDDYISHLVAIFAKVKRVLRPDGLLWVNVGDSYGGPKLLGRNDVDRMYRHKDGLRSASVTSVDAPCGLRNLVGVPWVLANALRDSGWVLRCDVVWWKTNSQPEGKKDRPTRAHEYIFMLSKGLHYAWFPPQNDGDYLRTVWAIPNAPTNENHYASFPEAIPRKIIELSSQEGDLILDPFCGTCTTGVAALRLNRRFSGIELSSEYMAIATDRMDRLQAELGSLGAAQAKPRQQIGLFTEYQGD